MKIKIAILLLITTSILGKGQNLVPNPSFEQYISCPDNWNELSYCQFWSSYRETPDYFNTCTPYQPPVGPYFGCPSNYDGFQYPHSGNAYVGLYIYYTAVPNPKELIGSQLLSSLITGQKYFISFYVSLGGGAGAGATIAANKMGVKFSTIPYSIFNPTPINNTAQFYCNTIIADTAKWERISGSFVADSAYNYIVLGNFFTDSLTDTVNIATTGNLCAYYFIDDVCLSTDSLYCVNWTEVNENSANNKEAISIYPNPATTQLTLTLPEYTANATYTLCNMQGIPQLTGKISNTQTEFNVATLPRGLYVLKIITDKQTITKKVVVQ